MNESDVLEVIEEKLQSIQIAPEVTKKVIHVCGKCGKKYKTTGFFKKHLETCSVKKSKKGQSFFLLAGCVLIASYGVSLLAIAIELVCHYSNRDRHHYLNTVMKTYVTSSPKCGSLKKVITLITVFRHQFCKILLEILSKKSIFRYWRTKSHHFWLLSNPIASYSLHVQPIANSIFFAPSNNKKYCMPPKYHSF